jgi:hypothetical protein
LLLIEAIPELARELVALLEQESENDLAAQVSKLRVIERCRCGDDFCATFYSVPKPQSEWQPKHENIVLHPQTGFLVLDVVDGKITCVEVLFRDDIRKQVLALLP